MLSRFEKYEISAFTGKKIKYIRFLETFLDKKVLPHKNRLFGHFLSFFEISAEMSDFERFQREKNQSLNVARSVRNVARVSKN